MEYNTENQVIGLKTNVMQSVLFRNVYLWMTMALTITGFTSYLVAGSHSVMATVFSTQGVFFGLLLAELALVWILSATINKLSFSVAVVMFFVYSVLNGVTMAAIFVLYTASSIASTFLVAAGTFGAMAVYGVVTKRDLSQWGNVLIMALVGVIIASLVNWFLKSETIYWIVTYAGVVIFTGLVAYDTQKIKHLAEITGDDVSESTQKLALMGALSLYLDFINLFLMLLRILGKRK